MVQKKKLYNPIRSLFISDMPVPHVRKMIRLEELPPIQRLVANLSMDLKVSLLPLRSPQLALWCRLQIAPFTDKPSKLRLLPLRAQQKTKKLKKANNKCEYFYSLAVISCFIHYFRES